MTSSGSVDISPSVSILGVLSHLNYEPWYALSEYVDNAIQSSLANKETLDKADESHFLSVNIDIDTDGEGRIVVEDNAAGIARDDFSRAFKAADVPPDRTGLSEFGMGMKSASIWFARRWSVETSSLGDSQMHTISFDMEEVLKGNSSELRVNSETADIDAHFTRITLSHLNQFPRGRTLGKIRDHMRDIYRVFLRSGQLRLTVAGERMAFREATVLSAADARYPNSSSVTWRKDISFDLPDGVEVRGFGALREEGSTKDAGFSLFRRNRSIIGSGDTPYRPSVIFGGGNSYKSQRLFGELHIDGLPVSHTKDGFQWGDHEELFHELLRQQLDSEPLPLMKQAENHRSRTITRQQARMIQLATESTVRSVENHLPQVINEVAASANDTIVPAEVTDNKDGLSSSEKGEQLKNAVTRMVEFELDSTAWQVTVESAQLLPSGRWLTSTVSHSSPGTTHVGVTLNANHPFVTQFALGDRDSFEAVLRLAVALVVAESLAKDAGQKFTRILLDQVNIVLTKALSAK